MRRDPGAGEGQVRRDPGGPPVAGGGRVCRDPGAPPDQSASEERRPEVMERSSCVQQRRARSVRLLRPAPARPSPLPLCASPAELWGAPPSPALCRVPARPRPHTPPLEVVSPSLEFLNAVHTPASPELCSGTLLEALTVNSSRTRASDSRQRRERRESRLAGGVAPTRSFLQGVRKRLLEVLLRRP